MQTKLMSNIIFYDVGYVVHCSKKLCIIIIIIVYQVDVYVAISPVSDIIACCE